MEPTLSNELWGQLRKDFGKHCLRFKAYEKANANFEESLTYQPEKLDSVYRLAKGQTFDGEIDEALETLNQKSTLGEIYIKH